MPTISEVPTMSVNQLPEKEVGKVFFQVFLGFKKPDGKISIEADCNVYIHLGNIFGKSPEEIRQNIFAFVYKNGDGFMQEYMTLDDASCATARASLFANRTKCTCFLRQEAHFQIKEVEK